MDRVVLWKWAVSSTAKTSSTVTHHSSSPTAGVNPHLPPAGSLRRWVGHLRQLYPLPPFIFPHFNSARTSDTKGG